MKNSYDKYMKEIWDAKEKVYADFIASGKGSYVDFIREQLKNSERDYHLPRKSSIGKQKLNCSKKNKSISRLNPDMKVND